ARVPFWQCSSAQVCAVSHWPLYPCRRSHVASSTAKRHTDLDQAPCESPEPTSAHDPFPHRFRTHRDSRSMNERFVALYNAVVAELDAWSAQIQRFSCLPRTDT